MPQDWKKAIHFIHYQNHNASEKLRPTLNEVTETVKHEIKNKRVNYLLRY